MSASNATCTRMRDRIAELDAENKRLAAALIAIQRHCGSAHRTAIQALAERGRE